MKRSVVQFHYGAQRRVVASLLGCVPPVIRNRSATLFFTSSTLIKTMEKESTAHLMAESINQIVNHCHNQAKNAGWHNKPRETGTCLMLIVSEIAEAMEGDRKGLMDDHLPDRKMFEVELADAAIRIFDLAGREGIDLGGALVEKLAYNLHRADHKIENRELTGGKKY